MTKFYVVVCLLGVMSLTQTFKVTPQPPTWPSAFSVDFHEVYRFINISAIPSNDGAWYYDYNIRRARFDHLQGQSNYFCQGRGLTLKDNHSDCHLIFATEMYVHYPREKQCCRCSMRFGPGVRIGPDTILEHRACGPAEGCTVLKPAWLTGAKYIGKQTISGMVCHGWEKQGAVAADRWYQREDGTPCQYWEMLSIPAHLLHTMTFNVSTYKVGPVQRSVFDVPHYCNITCPNPYP
ncbi:Hypp259 [Branchiostoma lanceolatum]|uniref:Hypp259 protein n=1 Tax=Branchiostoma lanceolatum TaxID=7740 RepID=A0A8J9YMX1_BRALA|nr:Hypp259 [Branchiostoma lanceolatum]